jgi:ferritin-like metal-binding protein YciE
MNEDQLHELLYQTLETEHGGVAVYTTAVRCATNDVLKKEWEEYLHQTTEHEQLVLSLFDRIGLDPNVDTVGRRAVRQIGEALVGAMEQTLSSGPPAAAQLVAGECVTLAETKDHLNWELLRAAADKAPKDAKKAISEACDHVENQEDEHLYHSTGWTRELWIEALGLPAVLPPPEERKHVTTAIAAAMAKNSRDEMT